ncbi:unnamed protein product [Gongylonema pulchrum]|uniref:Glyco_hydr_116N domain-containing protein n=1 Tax=Gongylonema pulchrum TaxID=637853 RepID=A0A183D5Q1_9BILA|nr:unnamed protein product [Gongylonema pulchrum]
MVKRIFGYVGSLQNRKLAFSNWVIKLQKDISLSRATFDPTSDGSSLWSALAEYGHLDNEGIFVERCDELGVALCAENSVEAQSSIDVEFILVWDMPVIKFGAGKREYKR